ncbi:MULTISPECIES: hypothetical protein [Shewanella]|uniref:DUF7683 domain-containing protein n=2 Tax=Shewanella TaxID=22 RepID=A0A9X2CEV8_9GAMM|nr:MULTISPECIES: hypothetical protein [Shewanella]AZG74835.1 hypothetical protein EGC82_20030 [Shewanella livingstonensis]MCL1106707.1 hypothetical protein [Shewanella algicola]GGP62251.1 hypothetical protein GCM10009347_30500 [Shewanella algicola]
MSKWYVVWYEKNGEKMIGEQSIALTLPEIREVLGVEADNPLEGCWPVKEGAAKHLSERVDMTINLVKFDYFLESYS